VADALILRDVRAGYGETVVLEDVRVSLAERGALAVLGRNGVGKTTLLGTIMGLTTFHSGQIEYRGRSIARLPVYERSRLGIGYVPQTRDVFPSLTLEENLAVAARPGRWTLAHVYELFPRLAARRRQLGGALSGGEQQMLSIARALVGQPSLLLLEGLAPIIVDGLLEALRRLIRDEALTVVLVEQSARLALEVTQEALVLNRGRVVHHGPSTELLADPQRLANLVVTT